MVLSNIIEDARREAVDLDQPFLAYLLEMASIEALRPLEAITPTDSPSGRTSSIEVAQVDLNGTR
jgi:hypothetical protein